MGILFGKSKKKETRVTEQDKAILVCIFINSFVSETKKFRLLIWK